ncbi:homoserine dehydrogenase [Phycisphaerales bacterium AB-hyl4]|uniref:Homoserine dehydrogenase n=1 Tax=Natronomicrosphaera hydrolytica TaxID=3242702 RepID=A0ABV4U128_9BACT
MAAKPIGIGMIGCGTVGGGVATLLREQAALYEQRIGRPIELRRVLVRDVEKACRGGEVGRSLVTADAEAFFDTPDVSVVVEVAGGRGVVSDYVRRSLKAGKHVVTANKALLAAEGAELFDLARRHHAAIAFEASCAGGIPCITALKFGLMANRIDGLYGILNGTCNFILTAMSQAGRAYDDVLNEAQEKGYAEADPTLDVSGKDAAQKLAILASLAFGVAVPEDAVGCIGIDNLDLADIRFGAELGYDMKLLAIAERKPGESAVSVGVQPCFIHKHELLAKVEGAFNALSVFGHAVGHTLYYGPGAGRMPTASAVVSDVLNVAAGWYPCAFADMHLTPDRNAAADLVPSDDRVSRYYLRINALDMPGTMAKVTSTLGELNISLSAVLQHESAVGEFVPVVVLTHDAKQGDLFEAVKRIKALDAIADEPVVIRIVDMPA